jgi:hypothetical protein
VLAISKVFLASFQSAMENAFYGPLGKLFFLEDLAGPLVPEAN